MLASRLGLVPFKGDNDEFTNWMKWYEKPTEEDGDTDQYAKAYDFNTIALELKIECTRNEDAAPGELDPSKAYHNAHVYAKDIVFKPFGQQVERFAGEKAIRPTNPDILIAKMRPGQCIDVEMHAIKGIGSDHAKFSPVATASYRLLPTISILKPILGADAVKFQTCFPKGVIGLVPVTKKDASVEGSGYEGHEGEKKAVVLDAMKDTVSRECLRHAEFEKKVKLGRIRDHFIFQIESLGQWDSDALFVESVKILKAKCMTMRRDLAEAQQ